MLYKEEDKKMMIYQDRLVFWINKLFKLVFGNLVMVNLTANMQDYKKKIII